MTHVQQSDQNNLAVVSLVLGIISLTGPGALTGIPAIVTGMIALKNPVNKGMSWAGIIMGSIATFLTILIIGFIVLLIVIGATAANSTPPTDQSNPYREPNYDQRRV